MDLQQYDVVKLGGVRLTMGDVVRIASGASRLEVADSAWTRVDASRQMVVDAVADGQTVYGVTTGFGALSDQTISPDSVRDLQINLLRSHASGTGHPLPDAVVRTILALRAHALAKGYSGVRRDVIQRLVDLYNYDILPVVPEQGSVGASGDLAPLAHLALPLAGEGQVRYSGRLVTSSDALKTAGLAPLTLEPKEALALINGTQAMTAIGLIAHCGARRVIDASISAAAVTVIALSGKVSSFDALVQQARPHPGQIAVASRLRGLLNGWTADPSKTRAVQDRYSIRALPQVIGAVLDTVEFTEQVLEREIDSATDNPLFFPDENRIINGANFHGHPVALACDHTKTAMSSLTTFSERRIASLVDTRASGLPAFLAAQPGLNSGLMIPHYLAASLVSENRVLAHPASIDSLSTSADVEDYNSMGTTAARNLLAVVENCSKVVAIELICAVQAIDLQDTDFSAAPVAAVYEQVRNRVPFLDRDRFGVGGWIESLAEDIRDGEITIPDV